MTNTSSVVAVFESHDQAEDAILKPLPTSALAALGHGQTSYPDDATTIALNRNLFVEQAFVQYREHVYQTARRLVANPDDAEDVTQDVFVKVVANVHQFRGESSLRTWLRRITINAALRHRQQRRGRREVQSPAALDALIAGHDGAASPQYASASPDNQVLSRETRAAIEQAVNRLPAPYKDAYVLADFDGCSNSEIGRRLGLTLPAVKTRLNRARLRIRKDLTAFGESQRS